MADSGFDLSEVTKSTGVFAVLAHDLHVEPHWHVLGQGHTAIVNRLAANLGGATVVHSDDTERVSVFKSYRNLRAEQILSLGRLMTAAPGGSTVD